jgi:hypothetical protein
MEGSYCVVLRDMPSLSGLTVLSIPRHHLAQKLSVDTNIRSVSFTLPPSPP